MQLLFELRNGIGGIQIFPLPDIDCLAFDPSC
jgi:hypothetical protein